MSSIYTECDECDESKWNVPISIITYNIEVKNILFELGLPEDICILILKKYVNTLTKCDYCNSKLCEYHKNQALWSGFNYKNDNSLLCQSCCWS
jgi:hypothetical protein